MKNKRVVYIKLHLADINMSLYSCSKVYYSLL